MKGLFRSLDEARVDFLPIGGQAAILYGAAQFTRDLDLWIRPTAANLSALVRALHAVRARVHKLTPPLTLEHVRRGHGFHSVVPQPGALPAFVDVRGHPPRVSTYAAARGRASFFATPWGRLPVVAIPELVESKKTNRPGDDDVILRRARLRLASLPSPHASRLRWALDSVFRAEDVHAIARSHAARLARDEAPSRAYFADLPGPGSSRFGFSGAAISPFSRSGGSGGAGSATSPRNRWGGAGSGAGVGSGGTGGDGGAGTASRPRVRNGSGGAGG